MKTLSLERLNTYVNENIVEFHQSKIESLEKLTLSKLLRKNPYLFRAKDIRSAGTLMKGLLDAFLSSSEEKLFGDFLENLAVFVAGETCNGRKSSAQGVDLEFESSGVHYIVSIKSGPNWGNSSQHGKLEQDLKTAVARLKQSKHELNVQPVLGICYGKTRTTFLRGYMKVVGQNFWFLISQEKNLYTEIVEPIGYRATEHNERFNEERARVENRFAGEFIEKYCDSNGSIDWVKLVELNSGNLDLSEIS